MACPNCRIDDVEPHADVAQCIAELRKRREALERDLEEFQRRYRPAPPPKKRAKR